MHPQTVLLVLDYALGYANSTSETVGPMLFYWYVCVLAVRCNRLV